MMPGMPDLQALLQQAQQMQADMSAAQSDLARTQVSGHAGGGLVTATVTGEGQLLSLTIDPSVVDPADVETLADLIVAAVRDAARAAAEIAERAMGSIAGGLGIGQGAGDFDLSAFGPAGLGDEYDDEDEDDDDEDEDDEEDDEEVADDLDVVEASPQPADRAMPAQQLPTGPATSSDVPSRIPPIGL